MNLPTRPFEEAIAFAKGGAFDAYLSVGGGSSIDTAKAANLYATHPADLLDYVNPPIGRGKPVPGPLKPHVAVPTTAGTGSETTGVAIFDLVEMHAKTGIAHRALRPTLGVIDPGQPPARCPPWRRACSGLDVLCHAVESLTALPYGSRPAPESPDLRPAYQGANPISDIWSAKAIELVGTYLLRVIQDSDDGRGARRDDARSDLRGHRLRQRRGPPAARDVPYPRGGHGERLPARGLQRGPPDSAARDVGSSSTPPAVFPFYRFGCA